MRVEGGSGGGGLSHQWDLAKQASRLPSIECREVCQSLHWREAARVPAAPKLSAPLSRCLQMGQHCARDGSGSIHPSHMASEKFSPLFLTPDCERERFGESGAHEGPLTVLNPLLTALSQRLQLWDNSKDSFR